MRDSGPEDPLFAAAYNAIEKAATMPMLAGVGSLIGSGPLAIAWSLNVGVGSGDMRTAASTYDGLATTFNDTAASVEGNVDQMGVHWQGKSYRTAQSAFKNHSSWVKGLATASSAASKQLIGIADAFDAAQKAAPKPAEVETTISNIAADVSAMHAAAGGPIGAVAAGAAAAKLVVDEGIYFSQWTRGAAALTSYQAAATPLMNTPQLTISPFVTPPGSTGGIGGMRPGPIGPTGGLPPHTSVPGPQSGPGPGTGPGPGSNPAPGPNPTPNPNPAPGPNPTPNPNPSPPAGQGPGTPNNPANPGLNTPGNTVDPGLPGASMNSPTLAGLNGGAGSMFGVGMFGGGIGAMSGESTGFRMPSNWAARTEELAKGTAYGAAEEEAAAAEEMAPPAVPRGAIAPEGTSRRKRDKKERSKRVVGDAEGVLFGDTPGMVGIIEYLDEDEEEATSSDTPIAVGVVEYVDDDG